MKTTYLVDGMTCGGCATSVTNALHALDASMTIEVNLEAKTVTVLETTAVIVALSVQHQNETLQLVGFCLTAQHPTRAPALAVLNATNRFLDTG